MRAPRGFMLSLLVLVSLAASAQPYPARPVRVLIPFTAGSAADIIARAMEPAMREQLGQPFVIDNRGGAGGNIAAEMTARATPDGHTIMMATIGTHAINHSLYSKPSFHPQRDFTPVALVAESPNALVINPKVQATSIQELIALAKSKPGGLIAFEAGGFRHRRQLRYGGRALGAGDRKRPEPSRLDERDGRGEAREHQVGLPAQQ